ncbi:MAG: DUF6516 family protein [Nitrosospira sp.]|nr:DUF6516 family protein [Nitrosospira sp.]
MPVRPTKGLDVLLDLTGERIVLSDGAWVAFEVRRVKPTPERPHGLGYSLTYHDRRNRRILGFDNAHAVSPKRSGYRARRVEYDHRHRHPKDKGEPFDFESPEQLLLAFWQAVDDWRNQQ